MNNFNYSGKLLDFTGLAIKTFLPDNKDLPNDLIFCATSRPFFYKLTDRPKSWFSSEIDPIDGFLKAFNIFSEKLNFKIFNSIECDIESCELILSKSTIYKPILVGPVDFSSIESNLFIDYHDCDGHFLVCTDKTKKGYRFCHLDGFIRIFTLAEILKYNKSFSRILFVNINTGKSKQITAEKMVNIFNLIPNYSKFLNYLLILVSNKKLTSKEKFSMHFGLSDFSIKNNIICDAIEYIIDEYSLYIEPKIIQNLMAICNTIKECIISCSRVIDIDNDKDFSKNMQVLLKDSINLEYEFMKLTKIL